MKTKIIFGGLIVGSLITFISWKYRQFGKYLKEKEDEGN